MSTLTASGGFVPPVLVVPAGYADAVRFYMTSPVRALPMFSAARGGIDFTPPEVRWARARERELRAARKFWDWPRVPDVAA